MKKILFLLLMLCVIITVCGCSYTSIKPMLNGIDTEAFEGVCESGFE